ncbi:MAG: winged helix-turn-helix domain-containing protein, partial [Candidatus Nanopelagicales bacterium]
GQLGHMNAVLMAGATGILSYPFDEVEFADELQREWETPRARNVSRSHLCVGLLELDAPSFSVTFDGRRLRLSLGAFELLWCLMVRANRVVGADEISRALGRPEGVLGSGAFVKAQVARLRTELGDRSVIQTVRGQGYTLRHLLEQPLGSARESPDALPR